MAVAQVGTRERKWPCWSGQEDRLARIVTAIEDHLDNRKRVAEVEIEAGADEAFRLAADANDEYEQRRILSRKEDALDRVDERYRITMIATEREMALTKSGPPEHVMAAMDRSALRKIELYAPEHRFSSSWRVEVTLSHPEGCELKVSGDPDWVNTVFGSMTDVIKRDVPWWAFLRSWIGATAGTVVILLNYFLVWPVPAAAGDEKGALLALAFGISYAAGLGIWWLLRRILPGFEVFGPGERGRGASALAVIGSIILAVVPSLF
jgi:hypothetical protein